MIVYGDRSRIVEVGPELARLDALWNHLSRREREGPAPERAWEGEGSRARPHHPLTLPPAPRAGPSLSPWERCSGVDRHGRFAAVFIALAELLQGAGDHAPEAEPALLALTTAAAAALRRSWDSGFAVLPPPPPERFAAAGAAVPERLTVKTAEGYAFYALYPEGYREAAHALSPDTRVIGLRSIGAGLACVVAEAAGAPPPLTVRPTGHPFAREIHLPALDPAAPYAIVDEGPGLSGSSFGAAADALEARGVPSDRIAFLPGHASDLGPQASEPHRARWRSARRLHVGFDALIGPRLAAWVEDLTGPALGQRDLSGGAWRTLTHGGDETAWPPSAVHQERRKLLIRSDHGVFLLKFVGLGEHGLAAAARARSLHAAGFTPEPLGWRHGFLVERWVTGRALTPADRPALLATLRRYLAFRREAFPAHAPGADLTTLAEMARVNAAEALGPALAARLPRPPPSAAPPVEGDHRLHAWEWRGLSDGRVLKTDAVDHALAHDLIGPQPPDWDLAGAVVEHDLSPGEAAAFGAVAPFWIGAYAAFQLGLWTQAADALAGWPEESARCRARAGVYAERLRALLTG